jgi:lipopolysaccharide/colanic/teichoic acid biosynthesis glycosyltransferase
VRAGSLTSHRATEQSIGYRSPKPSTLRSLPDGVETLPTHLKASLAGAHAAVVGDLLMLCPGTPHLTPGQRTIKRLVDVAGSLLLLILTAPLTILAAILIRLSSAGPAILVQTRVGAGGQEFSLYKLRTTIAGVEPETGPVMATAADPRITWIGRLLRGLRIDELPQLFNVLMGEMSLIGPRPERPYFASLYRERFPAYELRFNVKPGITGLAQIYCRYSTAPELKLHFDLKYIYNYSLARDIRILFRTLVTVLQPSFSQGFKEQPVWPPLASGD